MGTPREFPAYPPPRKSQSMWASPMVRLIVVLIVFFFISQILLYNMAIRSVRRIKGKHVEELEKSLIAEVIHRFQKAWGLLVF
jgi:hypothetical protein